MATSAVISPVKNNVSTPTSIGTNVAAAGTVPGVPTTGTPGVTNTSATNTLQPLPTTTAASGVVAPSTGISSGLSTVDGSNTLVGDFKDTYGAGTGTALADTLATLGTSTDSAVSATNNQILQAAQIQGANISSGLAASGLSADSSTNALAQGDFAAQVNTSLQSTDANMELNEKNLLISALQQEGSAHGSDSSTFDSILNGLGDTLSLGSSIGSIAGDISSATGASGTTASILDGIAAFA